MEHYPISPVGRVAKIVLSSLAPLQYFLDSPGITHVYCLDKALDLLRSDNKTNVLNYYQPFRTQIGQGLLWADHGWKNASHYFRQVGKQGLFRWPGAEVEFQFYYYKFLAGLEKDVHKSMFYLGAALHLVQDMCVPHHAVGAMFNGHQEFEQWVRDNFQSIDMTGKGLYLSFSHPSAWLEHNARFSARYYHLVSSKRGSDAYRQAAEILIPRTIHTTAGFLAFCQAREKQ